MKKIFSFIKKIFTLLKITFIALLLIFSVIFLVNNRNPVAVSFKPLPIDIFETRVFILMIASYLLGIFTAAMIYSKNLIKFGIARLRYKNRIQNLEKNLTSKTTFAEQSNQQAVE